MTWKPVSKELLLDASPTATLWGSRPIQNASEIVKAGRCHVFAWPLRYNTDIHEDYEGLAIHTSPYTWRGIPLHIPRSNLNSRFKVYVYAKTVPSYYATKSQFGGAVDLWVDDGGNPPTNVPWGEDPRESSVGFTSFSRRINSSSNAYTVTEFTVDTTAPSHYQAEGAPNETSTITLWIRSTIGDAVTIPSPIVFGTPVDEFFGYRRSALELPLSYVEEAEKIALTGRVLQKTRRPVSLFAGSMAMNPYPDFYFVEAETTYTETRDPLKPDEEFYAAFCYPPFPTEVLDLMNIRNRRFFAQTGNPAEFVESVLEATGLRIASVTVEEIL